MKIKTLKKLVEVISSIVFYICFFILLYLLPNRKSRIIGGILIFLIVLSVIYKQGVKYGMKKLPEDELLV